MRRTRRRRKARLPATVDYSLRLPAMTGSQICWDLLRFAAWDARNSYPGSPEKEGDRQAIGQSRLTIERSSR